MWLSSAVPETGIERSRVTTGLESHVGRGAARSVFLGVNGEGYV